MPEPSPMQAQEQALLSWLAQNGRCGDSSQAGNPTDGTSHGPNQSPLNSWLMESWQNMAMPNLIDYTVTTKSLPKGGTRVSPTTDMSTLLSDAFTISLTK